MIGAGTAGLATAAGAAGLGARVALIELNLMGGDCLNVECVPSKAVIRASRAYAEIRDAARFGAAVNGAEMDFGVVMERMRQTGFTIPRCTYTDPEVAAVGLNEADAERDGLELDTLITPLSEVDRALADGEERGFVKIHLKRGTDRIAGATIVARHVGEMINEITLAMVAGVGLGTRAGVIHPYPTRRKRLSEPPMLTIELA